MSSECLYFDPQSGFELDYSSFEASVSFASPDCQEKTHRALSDLHRIEAGETVNYTEGRAVDHYNLRHVAELVAGKSLEKSLAMWEHVVRTIDSLHWSQRFDSVIFNGIGGSYLGPLMMLVAMRKLHPKFRFLANTDPESFQAVIGSAPDPHRILMVHMSKSGSTAETKGNLEAFLAVAPGENNIAITIDGSFLHKLAMERGFAAIFPMNVETGGRTSVWSAIGAVPCAFAGVDFGQFLRGASHMDELTRCSSAENNPALILSLCIDSVRPRKNMIYLCYHDALSEYAHYLQQLYMESLGKEHPSPQGQTVFGGVGTGEQHAFMQQVQKGVHDAFVRFLHVRGRQHDFPNEKAGSMGRQLLSFVRGTQNALQQNGRQFLSESIARCDEFNLGMCIALEERVVSFLAAFWKINAYDQPGVEDGKKAADQMNALSKAIEQAIRSSGTSGQEGTAGELFPTSANKLFADTRGVEMILEDIAANAKLCYSLGGKAVQRTGLHSFRIVQSAS